MKVVYFILAIISMCGAITWGAIIVTLSLNGEFIDDKEITWFFVWLLLTGLFAYSNRKAL